MKDPDRGVCPRKFWFDTDLHLSAIGELLVKWKIVASAAYDYENVYEWLECELDGTCVKLNVSRKHCEFETDGSKPTSFLLIGSDLTEMMERVDRIASEIAAVLQLPVTIGEINYLGNDKFQFVPKDK